MATDHTLYAAAMPHPIFGASPFFDATGKRIAIPDLGSIEATCDLPGCGARFDHPTMTIVNLTNFTRVNVTRFWHFCSTDHRAAWWALGDVEDFLPVSPADHHVCLDDGAMQLNLIHYDGPGVHNQMMALRDPDSGTVIHRTPGDLVLCAWMPDAIALNRWWRTADKLTSLGDVEILYSKAA